MGYDWYELRSCGQERLQRYVAEADEWRLARQVQPARPAGPSVWQTLAGALRRLAARQVPSPAAR
jgi:hypothetical protein